jgi:hypothetical protein
MHLHLPKPLHGWRAFAGEVGVIVLGVLIALFLEQLVDTWEWHQKIAAAKAAMRDELLVDDGPQAYQRAAMHPCLVARLDAIRAAVDGGASRQEVGRLVDSYWVDIRTYDRLALDAVNASDVASHMPHDELVPFTTAYRTIPLMDRTNAQESVDMSRLRAFTRTGGPMTLQEKDALLSALEALRNDENTMWVKSRVHLFELHDVGSLYPRRVRMFMNDARAHYGACVKELPPGFPSRPPH